MKVDKKQLELLSIEDDRAFFAVDGVFNFDVSFDYETEDIKAELDYFNGTGVLECTEVTFIDVIYISYLYDEETPLGGFDVDKSDLENIIKEKLESDLND